MLLPSDVRAFCCRLSNNPLKRAAVGAAGAIASSWGFLPVQKQSLKLDGLDLSYRIVGECQFGLLGERRGINRNGAGCGS